jgi:hypothetical protein
MRVLAAAVVIAAASTAHAGSGAIAVPPMEVDVGEGAQLGGATVGPSTEILAGIHWASLYWHPTHYDVGIGYVGSYRQVLPGYALRATGEGTIDNTLSLNGSYLSLGYTIDSHSWCRTWLDARVEALRGSVNNQSFNALGEALRISSELYVSAAVGDGGGGGFVAMAGTWALGVYVEAVHRALPPELGSTGVSAGMSFRVPFIIAAG